MRDGVNFVTTSLILGVSLKCVLCGILLYSTMNINTCFLSLNEMQYNCKWIKISLLQMITSWHGNLFRITGSLWGKSTGDGWIPFTQCQLCGTTFDGFSAGNINKLLKKCRVVGEKWPRNCHVTSFEFQWYTPEGGNSCFQFHPWFIPSLSESITRTIKLYLSGR